MARIDRWTEERHIRFAISAPEKNPALVEALRNSPAGDSKGMSLNDLIAGCREMIFRVAGSSYEFDYIDFTLDANTGTLRIGKTWHGPDLDEKEVKKELALAISCDVPVYPDTDADVDELSRLYASLFSDGFVIEHDGEEVRRTWAGTKAIEFDDKSGTWAIQASGTFVPAEILSLARGISEREQSVSEAVRVLADLRSAIDELSGLLSSTARDESSLQRCLTRYPILFGLQYSRVVPKYRLGKDFEMDYALVQVAGTVDLVEIEPSNFKLYTKSGNPTSNLVHAEQQVMDWLEWLESNVRYARDDFPDLVRPTGQVIIGTSGSLTEDDRRRLRRRNAMWNGAIVVLTFDDLLARARNCLARLTP